MSKHAQTPQDAEPLLRVRSSIDDEAFERIYAAVKASYSARVDVLHHRTQQRIMKYLPKPHARQRTIVTAISAVGLIVALLFTANGGLFYAGYRLDLIFIAYFVTMPVLTLGIKPFERWWYKRQASLHAWMAEAATRRMLKAAGKSVPFVAEYEIFDDEIAYSRVIDGTPKRLWKRKLRGVRVTGDGFTLLYKKSTTQEPHGILLHPPSAEFDAQLDRLGLNTSEAIS